VYEARRGLFFDGHATIPEYFYNALLLHIMGCLGDKLEVIMYNLSVRILPSAGNTRVAMGTPGGMYICI